MKLFSFFKKAEKTGSDSTIGSEEIIDGVDASQIQMRSKRHSPFIRNGMFHRSRNMFSVSFQMNLNHLNQTKFPFPALTSTSNLLMVAGSLKHFSVLPLTNKFRLDQSN